MFYICFLHFRGKSTFTYTGRGAIFFRTMHFMQYVLYSYGISLQKRIKMLNGKYGKTTILIPKNSVNFCNIINLSFLFAGMCILFHIRGDRLHRHLRAQHHARAGRHGRTEFFCFKRTIA